MTDNAEKNTEVSNLVIRSLRGAALCDIVEADSYRQANVYLPPNGGAAIFALFPLDASNDGITSALAPAINGDALEPDQEITDRVSGCILAGTIKRPSLKVSL